MCFLPVLKNKSQAVSVCPWQLAAKQSLGTAAASRETLGWALVKHPLLPLPSHQGLFAHLGQTETSQEVTERAGCVVFIRPL